MKQYNPSFAVEQMRLFNLKTGDMSSSEVHPFIQPVVEIRPRPTNLSAAGLNATSAAFGTTSNNRDTYILSWDLSYDADATAVATIIRINYTYKGATRTLARLAKLTLTAGKAFISGSVPYPGLPVDRNTGISIALDDATGNIAFCGQVHFYEIDTTNNI